MNSLDNIPIYPELYQHCTTFPAIDNHAHPLLKAEHRTAFPFEGLVSEANNDALIEDSIHTLACFRATAQLRDLFNLNAEASWEDIKAARLAMNYEDLCRICFEPTGIQCILIDDGLGGVKQFAEDYKWHDRFTSSPNLRIVRVEIIAEAILAEVLAPHLEADTVEVVPEPILESFTTKLTASLTAYAKDEQVVGFKSIVCYRTGLDISTWTSTVSVGFSLLDVFKMLKDTGGIRLAHKALNDYVVRIALEVAGKYNKPVQFHTGLGDNDIKLVISSPSYMQPIIKAYPNAKIVLLHSSYPYTREAGYLTAVYKNVYLDFGEIFPIVSGSGQQAVIRQILELCPTNKIMWSTDGHWWPESYYLGSLQARQALYNVLAETIHHKEITEKEAVKIVQNALFHNANQVYQLGLKPSTSLVLSSQ